MKRLHLIYIMIAVCTFLASSPALAAPLAWPGEPPDKAFISGPGLEGQIEITDQRMLEALKLGAIEDFNQGPIPAPNLNLSEGYTITRYFYEGQFNFGVLHYFPGRDGARAYIYFEDGPDFQGDHTEFDHQWLYATPTGEAAMKDLFMKLGISQSQQATSPLSPFVWRLALLSAVILTAGTIFFFGGRRMVKTAAQRN